MKQVNTVIILSLGLDLNDQKISESTAWHWLVKLGYKLKEVKKGVYVDGHEHEDVVAYCQNFLEQFTANESHTYQDEDLEPVEPVLAHGEKLHIPIMHDKKMPLQKKGHGHAIHVSNFIVEQTGRLVLSEAQLHQNATLPERLCGWHQTMNFAGDLTPDHPDFEFCGQPKGMYFEGGKWREGCWGVSDMQVVVGSSGKIMSQAIKPGLKQQTIREMERSQPEGFIYYENHAWTKTRKVVQGYRV
ncbi:uncharacterized protein EDB91DRAFT_1079789 [Suillus paluster]|uniref:uncharacterized protein n=1 Tax=Suillus paluster TaxID=48578 RepID=UPI001B86EEAB|nr:uncharacterized protein EDB91DRAFT_1079789 [Suillus paluster]KAG1747174.1 hypothetical protein EDB91DRAFT_1079789 [Suillus paluster]